VAVHDPSQHRPEPGPRPVAGHGGGRQRDRGPGRRRAATGGLSAGAAETPESLLIRETLAPELQEAIDALPEAFRQAVWLRDVEEFSYAEIAAMLSIPIGTVMSRISRGRRLLFERLKESAIGRRQTAVAVGED